METKNEIEARRIDNYHTVEELLNDGNKVQHMSTNTLIMARGKTTTHYAIKKWKGDNYWYPIAANTTQR